jgi:hypothetical protein
MAACEKEVVMSTVKRPINAATKRRMNQLVRSAVALEIIRGQDSKERQLDEELMPTDRIMQRWAASIGSGMPESEWDTTPKSKPPVLDDESAMIIDQIVLKAPHRYRTLLLPWYKGNGSSTTIQQKLGVSRHGLYFEWRCSLFYVRQEIRRTGHSDLTNLLDIFV